MRNFKFLFSGTDLYFFCLIYKWKCHIMSLKIYVEIKYIFRKILFDINIRLLTTVTKVSAITSDSSIHEDIHIHNIWGRQTHMCGIKKEIFFKQMWCTLQISMLPDLKRKYECYSFQSKSQKQLMTEKGFLQDRQTFNWHFLFEA